MQFDENNFTPEEADRILLRIGQRIREKRISKGISQVALAKKMSMQKASLCRIEAGQRNISVYSLHKIACALEVNEKELLTPIPGAGEPSYESVVLLQAQYRRTGDSLKSLSADLKEILASLRSASHIQDRIQLHEMAREYITRRSALLAKLNSISDAMLKK